VNLILLYFEFFQIGVLAVGGGLATLPFLFLMANDRSFFIRQTGWLSQAQLGNFIAIAQCAPGAIGVNIAAQTGFQYGGISGAILASFGLISPAIIVVSLISKALQSIKENKTVDSIFKGLRPAAAGLLTAAGWGVWQLALINSDGAAWHEIFRWKESRILITLFLLIVKFKTHPVILVAIGAAAGIAFSL
jgi:chromate transporter